MKPKKHQIAHQKETERQDLDKAEIIQNQGNSGDNPQTMFVLENINTRV